MRERFEGAKSMTDQVENSWCGYSWFELDTVFGGSALQSHGGGPHKVGKMRICLMVAISSEVINK